MSSNLITVPVAGYGDYTLTEEEFLSLTPEQLQRRVVQETAQYLEANDIDIDSFSRQFTKEVTSTSRGLQEMATGERTTDAKSDFLAEVAIEKDPWKAYTGMAAGALLDPVTLPAAFLKVLKLGRIGTAALAGAFGGGAGAVREEYGESRLANAAFGAGAGGILGAGVEVLMRKFGVNSVEALQKAVDEGGIEAERLVEETLKQESEALVRMGDAGRERAAKEADVQSIRDVAESPEVLRIQAELEAERAAKAADVEAIQQVGKEADVERIKNVGDDILAERQADVTRQIEAMREEVAQLPTGSQQRIIENSVRETKGKVASLNKKIAQLSKRINDTKKDKKINPKQTRAIVQPLQAEVKRLQQEAGKLRQNQGQTYQPLADRLKELRRAQAEIREFDKSGKIPSFVKINEPIRPYEGEAPELSMPSMFGGTPEVPLTQRDTSIPEQVGGVPALRPQDAQAARIQRNLERAQARPSPEAPQAPVRSDVVEPTPTTAQAVEQPTTAPAAPQAKQNKVVRAFDTALGAISTRLEAIAPEIMNAVRDFERKVLEKQSKLINPTEPFFKAIDNFSPDMKEKMKAHLYNGEFEEAMAMMNPEMKKQFAAIRRDLYNVHRELKKAGIDVDYIENYFPRRVKDVEGLRDVLNRQHKDKFTKALEDAIQKNKGKPLDAEQEEAVLNAVVRDVYRPKDPTRRGNLGKRSFNEIPEEVLEFYHDPSMSLTTYYRNMTDMAEKAKFFGRSRVVTDQNTLDSVESIGNVIRDARIRHNLNPQQVEDLTRLLTARFVEGEKSPNALSRWTRDTGYMGTIGNFVSAITNLGDLGTSGALHGFSETIAAALRSATGRKIKYDVVDMGIDHSISHELQDNKATAKALQKVFTWSGFRFTDRLGKNSLMNAAMSKNEKLAKTEAGRKALRDRWSKYFGDETEALLVDLENKNVTENTKLLAFHELSNVQPITLSEMPQYYLEHPDGRIVYMMKSFTLKQLDLVRRHIYQEAKRGNVFQATKNLALLGGYLAAANTGTQVIKDWMLGRDIDPDKLPEQAMWNVFSVFGVNKYIADRYLSQGDVMGAITNTLVPPVPVLEVARKGYKEAERMIEGEEYNYAKLSKELPVVGSLIYSHFGGGKENYNERLAKED